MRCRPPKDFFIVTFLWPAQFWDLRLSYYIAINLYFLNFFSENFFFVMHYNFINEFVQNIWCLQIYLRYFFVKKVTKNGSREIASFSLEPSFKRPKGTPFGRLYSFSVLLITNEISCKILRSIAFDCWCIACFVRGLSWRGASDAKIHWNVIISGLAFKCFRPVISLSEFVCLWTFFNFFQNIFEILFREDIRKQF